MANNDGWQSIHTRGQQTNAVWQTHAPALNVSELTLALHQADVAAMPPASQLVADKQDLLDDKRAARDAAIATIRDLTVRMPRKIEGELAHDDPFHKDLRDIRTVEVTSPETALTRGQRTIALLKKYNARNAAALPVRPPLTVGGLGVAVLEAAVGGLPGTTQAVEDAISGLKDLRDAQGVLSGRVDRNNKRWYVAWKGEFVAGSPERSALSQIDTGSSGEGDEVAEGGGGGEVLGPPQNVVVNTGAAGSGAVVFSWDPVAGAASYNIYNGATLVTTVTVPPAELPGFATGDSVSLTVAAVNAAGEGAHSEVATGTAG